MKKTVSIFQEYSELSEFTKTRHDAEIVRIHQGASISQGAGKEFIHVYKSEFTSNASQCGNPLVLECISPVLSDNIKFHREADCLLN